MALTITQKSARRFLLRKQLLYPPQQFRGKKGIAQVFQTLRVVQYDPLNPCGRNTDLVLQARVTNIHPNDYYDWLYIQKKGIECYDKELCIIPIEDLVFTAHTFAKSAMDKRMLTFIAEHERELEQLLVRIEKEGPLTSSDIKDLRRAEIFWSEEQWGRAALETLWKTGRIVIGKREKGRKYYDSLAKAFADKKSIQSDETITTEHIVRRLQSVGILPASGSGTGWQGIGPAALIKPIIASLIHHKTITEVQVAGLKRPYVIQTSDVPLLSKKSPVSKKVVFIAPLDTLLWDRVMIKDFFDFDYRWEVYVPANKRKFGYYVLPILYGDTFIGRIEPVLKDGKLLIKGLWKEPTVVWDKNTQEAFEKALERFKTYVHATEIIYK